MPAASWLRAVASLFGGLGGSIGAPEIDGRSGNRQVLERNRSSVLKPVHVAVSEACNVTCGEWSGRVIRQEEGSGTTQCDPHLFRCRVLVPGVHCAGIDDNPRERDTRRSGILGKQQLVRCNAGKRQNRDLIVSDDFHSNPR